MIRSYLAIASFSFVALAALAAYIQFNRVTNRFIEQTRVLKSNMDLILASELRFISTGRQSIMFHETGFNLHLKKREETIARTISDFNTFQDQFGRTEKYFNTAAIDSSFLQHDLLFDSLVHVIRTLGFKDYGAIGEMRQYAHKLEDSSWVDKVTLLQLRRAEKDFLERDDFSYVDRFLQFYDQELHVLQSNADDREALETLRLYKDAFLRVSMLSILIGDSDTGLMQQYYTSLDAINHDYNLLTSKIFSDVQVTNQLIHRCLFALLIVLVISSVYTARNKAKARAQPLINLTNQINKMVESDYKSNAIRLSEGSKELERLGDSFNHLVEKLTFKMREVHGQKQRIEIQNESLKKVNGELDHFVYRVSHDLRAPLASLLGLINVARIQQQEGILEMMETSVNKLDKFIANILDYSKNSRTVVRKEIIDLESFTRTTLDSLGHQEDADNLTLYTDFGEFAYFYSDSIRLQIVFNNIFSNAIKYRDKKKTCSYLRVSTSYSNGIFKFIFEDNGIGIDSTIQHRVFDMFYRASYISQGSGLGLYIVKDTIEKMEGSIVVHSEEQEFTRFVIGFPVNDEEHQILMEQNSVVLHG